MAERLRIVLAQINQVVGDLAGNKERILKARRDVPDADLMICPELSISGYPPEDLVLRPSYVEACRRTAKDLARAMSEEPGPAIIVGCPWPDDDDEGPRPFNAALLLDEGEVRGVARKVCLPNYGPFDEPRTFKPGPLPEPIDFRGVRLGVMICEDMWFPHTAAALAGNGADILIVPHGSPFRQSVHAERRQRAEVRSQESGLPLLFVNQVGGQDELVFDGGGFAFGNGKLMGALPLFEEALLQVDLVHSEDGWQLEEGPIATWPQHDALIYEALVVGTRDYVRKSGFKDVVIGLSGGIDSALVAAIAADALGPERVHCVRLPSVYTSEASMSDAEACAEAIGARLDTVSIEPAVDAMTGMLADLFSGREPDVTEENLQSRIRGALVMAISNKLGSMMLTTGNKSEMSVGYATLYGDMNGGYNPLKDVYKTQVFSLCRWRNAAKPGFALGRDGEVIPEAIITKPPSAELRPDQKDEDSLPPYDVLDAILYGLTEEDLGVRDIVARGHDEETVRRVERLLFIAEYKRRQSAPGPKVSSKYFGRDRRYPIVNSFRG